MYTIIYKYREDHKMVCCGVHCDVDGRENDVPFGFTLLCFIEVSFLYCDIYA